MLRVGEDRPTESPLACAYRACMYSSLFVSSAGEAVAVHAFRFVEGGKEEEVIWIGSPKERVSCGAGRRLSLAAGRSVRW